MNDPDHDQQELEEGPQLRFPSAEVFFTAVLGPSIERRIGRTRTWCPHWWEHPEARARIDVLWIAWEESILDGGQALSDWWLRHADPHLAVLMDTETGPFARCSPDRGHDPASMFPTLDTLSEPAPT